MESGMSIQVQRDLNKAKDVQQHEECSIMSRIIQLSTTKCQWTETLRKFGASNVFATLKRLAKDLPLRFRY
jgi:hypothetical protein